MSAIGAGAGPAFLVAAAELGMCSAAWLFVGEVAAEGGDALVEELRDRLGREYPVLDAVAAQWLDGRRPEPVDPGGVLEACAGAANLLIVGAEARFLDALLPRLGKQTKASLLTHGTMEVDWERVVANHRGLETVDISSFQSLAGRRSVLLTFLYGVHGETTWVDPAWLRVIGADVRTQFRSIVGWDVLGGVMYVYPRWMTETTLRDFSHVVHAS